LIIKDRLEIYVPNPYYNTILKSLLLILQQRQLVGISKNLDTNLLVKMFSGKDEGNYAKD
jgi:hypothetical protein